jgi:hypothetical protein
MCADNLTTRRPMPTKKYENVCPKAIYLVMTGGLPIRRLTSYLDCLQRVPENRL